ncbi:hypothetical protein [Escherichia coli]|uniref:hypothetical protein n=1 Tax=Escherichia coli TaxID=562 RepID=UPI003C306131
MFKHWKNITIYKLSREADLTDLEDKKKMILFTPCGSQDMAKFIDRNLNPKKIKKTPKNGCLFNTACVP